MNTDFPQCDARLPARHDEFVQRYQPPASIPLGPIEIRATALGLTWIVFSKTPGHVDNPNAVTARCAQQLEAYFLGQLTTFDLPLALRGTDFQARVWQALRTIPYGQTRSYREIAVAIGAPSAVRAVGAANGRNPISLVIPCHRVIGSDGRLTGYAGGIGRKHWLLRHEQTVSGERLAL